MILLGRRDSISLSTSAVARSANMSMDDFWRVLDLFLLVLVLLLLLIVLLLSLSPLLLAVELELVVLSSIRKKNR